MTNLHTPISMYCKLMQIPSFLAAVFFSLWTLFINFIIPKPALKPSLADVTENTEQGECSTNGIHRQLKQLLSANYSIQFNVLNEQEEYGGHGEDGTGTPYRLLDRIVPSARRVDDTCKEITKESHFKSATDLCHWAVGNSGLSNTTRFIVSIHFDV